MDAIEAIINKRDVRHYTTEVVAPELQERLVQAARMAGSAKNRENIRLLLVEDPEAQTALTSAGDFASWIDTAPLIVGFVVPVVDGNLFDVGRMAQNVMVAATALGLATCPVTLHHQDVARSAVGLPADLTLPMVVTVGHPSPDAPPSPLRRRRIDATELVRRDRWS